MSKAKTSVIVAAVIAAMLIHPIGRSILIFLWPIDPGHEDTVVLMVFVLLGAFIWTRIPKLFRK